MTTAAEAFAIVKNRITAGGLSVTLCWQNEDVQLPDTPAKFIYTEFLTDPADLVAFGGGVGRNLYRNPAQINSYVFVPRGSGITPAMQKAEQVAFLFRSYRDPDISCFDASVLPGGDGADFKPPGIDSEVANYFWALARTSLHFDQIG